MTGTLLLYIHGNIYYERVGLRQSNILPHLDTRLATAERTAPRHHAGPRTRPQSRKSPCRRDLFLIARLSHHRTSREG